ncbi:hypothetical protein LguiA_003604 [Lonicera macranthoides]
MFRPYEEAITFVFAQEQYVEYAGGGNKYLYGTKLSEKASIDQWLEVQTRNFNQPSSELVLSLAFGNPKKSRQEEAQIKQNVSKLNKVLDMYERWLGESLYLAGVEFTLTDTSHLPNTQFLVSATDRGKLVTLMKNVWRWWAAVSGQESRKKVVARQNSPPPPSA